MKQSNGRLLVLAISEGGPPIVHAILSQLTINFPLSIALCQVSQSGSTDPLCNALNRTTQLAVTSVEKVGALSAGLVCMIPYGFGVVIQESSRGGEPAIRPVADAVSDASSFVQFLRSACRFYGERIKVALAGGPGPAAESLLPGLEAVCDCGGEIVLISDPEIAVASELQSRLSECIRIRCLTADEMVSLLYGWCGNAEKARYPI